MKVQDDARSRLRTLFSEAEIAERVEELARELAGKNLRDPLFVPILKSSFIFAADLLRAMHRVGLTPEVEFMMLASYRGDESSGQISVGKDIDSPVEGRDVILIDDILETGRTIAYARDLLMARGANRVLLCCLLEKTGKRAVDINADCVGFVCPDHFVVGYGMDVSNSFRELPFIGFIAPQEQG